MFNNLNKTLAQFEEEDMMMENTKSILDSEEDEFFERISEAFGPISESEEELSESEEDNEEDTDSEDGDEDGDDLFLDESKEEETSEEQEDLLESFSLDLF